MFERGENLPFHAKSLLSIPVLTAESQQLDRNCLLELVIVSNGSKDGAHAPFAHPAHETVRADPEAYPFVVSFSHRRHRLPGGADAGLGAGPGEVLEHDVEFAAQDVVAAAFEVEKPHAFVDRHRSRRGKQRFDTSLLV